MNKIVAIDGPAAAGKGTLARRLAAELGLPYLDTGLLYRATARRLLDAGGDPAHAEAQARALQPADLNRTDLRTPEVDRAAAVASLPPVRAALLDFQRNFGAHKRRCAGRPGHRHHHLPRRPRQTLRHRQRRRPRPPPLARTHRPRRPAELQTVREDMEARDAADASRAAAPLRPAENAFVLDTTELDAERFRRGLGIREGKTSFLKKRSKKLLSVLSPTS